VFSNWSAYTPLNYFFEALALAAFVVEAWAFGDALYRPSRSYLAASKLTKPLWLIITGVAAAIGLGYAAYVKNLSIIQILPVVAFVAASVYLTDVRPKVKELSGKGSKGPQQHMGPYGPW
jgi:predicted cobalt transporter CbtA